MFSEDLIGNEVRMKEDAVAGKGVIAAAWVYENEIWVAVAWDEGEYSEELLTALRQVQYDLVERPYQPSEA